MRLDRRGRVYLLNMPRTLELKRRAGRAGHIERFYCISFWALTVHDNRRRREVLATTAILDFAFWEGSSRLPSGWLTCCTAFAFRPLLLQFCCAWLKCFCFLCVLNFVIVLLVSDFFLSCSLCFWCLWVDRRCCSNYFLLNGLAITANSIMEIMPLLPFHFCRTTVHDNRRRRTARQPPQF